MLENSSRVYSLDEYWFCCNPCSCGLFFFSLMSPQRGVFFFTTRWCQVKIKPGQKQRRCISLGKLTDKCKEINLKKREAPEKSSSGKYFWLLYLITQPIVLTKHFYRTGGILRGLIYTVKQHWGLWLYVSFLLTAVLVAYSHQIPPARRQAWQGCAAGGLK